MNKIFKGFIFILIFFLLLGRIGYWECHYTKNGEVAEVGIIYDETGYIWHIDTSAFSPGDKVKITFHTNHTDMKIEDDIIEEVSSQ